MNHKHMASSKETEKIIQSLHEQACKAGLSKYIDPISELEVLTKDFLEARGFCCNQGCRHCPYGDTNVSIRFK